MQFATVFVQQERHRHAPTALARDAPIRAIGDHVAQTGLAVFWIELGVLNRIKRELAQGLCCFVRGENANALIHTHKPLGSSTVDDGCFVAPAMWIAVADAVRSHQTVGVFQRFQNNGNCFPNVLTAKQ